MKSRPRPGATAEVTFVAEENHAIDFAEDGMPSVLSTLLIWFMEHSAREAMLPHLEPRESTVGMAVDIEHLAPTPTGNHVTCRAQVLRSEDNQFHFKLEAFDEYEDRLRPAQARGDRQVAPIQRVERKENNRCSPRFIVQPSRGSSPIPWRWK